MSDELETYFVVLAVDREKVHTFIEGVVPAMYQPPSYTHWCMCKAPNKDFAITMARETYEQELRLGESLHIVSVARLCSHEEVR